MEKRFWSWLLTWIDICVNILYTVSNISTLLTAVVSSEFKWLCLVDVMVCGRLVCWMRMVNWLLVGGREDCRKFLKPLSNYWYKKFGMKFLRKMIKRKSKKVEILFTGADITEKNKNSLPFFFNFVIPVTIVYFRRGWKLSGLQYILKCLLNK